MNLNPEPFLLGKVHLLDGKVLQSLFRYFSGSPLFEKVGAYGGWGVLWLSFLPVMATKGGFRVSGCLGSQSVELAARGSRFLG